jgi:hypothetical protein
MVAQKAPWHGGGALMYISYIKTDCNENKIRKIISWALFIVPTYVDFPRFASNRQVVGIQSRPVQEARAEIAGDACVSTISSSAP